MPVDPAFGKLVGQREEILLRIGSAQGEFEPVLTQRVAVARTGVAAALTTASIAASSPDVSPFALSANKNAEISESVASPASIDSMAAAATSGSRSRLLLSPVITPDQPPGSLVIQPFFMPSVVADE